MRRSAPRPFVSAALLLALAACDTELDPATADPGEAALAAPVPVVVDLGAVRYPASPRKLGFNALWDERSVNDLDALHTAEALGVPVVAGLVDTQLGPEDALDADSVFFPGDDGPLFQRRVEGGPVEAAVTPALADLVDASAPMIRFVQLAGIPCATTLDACESVDAVDPLFHRDPTLTDPEDGHWYPLPVADEVPDMAEALADLARQVDDRGGRTIWALWQEPDHTIDRVVRKDDKAENLYRYLGLYRAFAAAVHARDPDAMLAGPQQNQATGTNDGHIDGAGFNAFVHNQALGPDIGLGAGEEVPLDLVSVQNYRGGLSTTEVLQNLRVAYADPRFDLTSVMFNEWDLDKDVPFEANYETPAGVSALLDQVLVAYDAPDLAYLLLKRDVVGDDTVLAQHAVAFLESMGPHRRPVTLEEGAGVAGLAAGDDASTQVLLWNRTADARPVDLDLLRVPGPLASGLVTVELSDGTRSEAPVSSFTGQVTLPPHGFAAISLGEPPVVPPLELAYARHVSLVDRAGLSPGQAPHGMGAYDARSRTMVVSVDGSAGVGAAGVVFRGVDADDRIVLTFDLDGVPASAGWAVRVDYLQGDDSVLTRVLRDSKGWTGAVPTTSLLRGTTALTRQVETTFVEGKRTIVALGGSAPKGWTEGRVMVSLVLAGSSTPATLTARLSTL